MENNPIIEIKELQKSFGGIEAVDGLNFDIERESITGLIGPNGAGKSTAFKLVSGFHQPDAGVIKYNDQDTYDLMHPTDEERIMKSSAAGITFGVIGSAIGATLQMTPVALGGISIVGVAAGIGSYFGIGYLNKATRSRRSNYPFQLTRMGMARTFQISREIQDLTVLENLMLASSEQQGENLFNTLFRQKIVANEEVEIRERAEELLELLEIDHLSGEYAGNLSGGQRKLLELGRVLMTDPKVILLDEPMAGVNPTLGQKLCDFIKALRDDGYTFCIIEHDIDMIMNISDKIVVMDQGKKLVEGTPDKIRSDERVIDAYLGG